MPSHSVSRPVAASGMAAFVLVIAGLVVSVAAGRPETTMSSSPEELREALAQSAGAGVWIGAALQAAGLVALMVFAALLVGRPAPAAGRAVLARAAFGCAVAFAAVSFAALALGGLIGDLAGNPVEPSTAVLLNDLWGALYAASWAPCGAFLVLTGAALWRTGLLPQGLLAAAFAIGALSFATFAAPASAAGQAIGLLPWLWTTAASAVLVRRARRVSATAPSAVQHA